MKPLIACLLASTLLPAVAEQPLFSEIGDMEKGLTQITGLSFKHAVPYAVINKDQLRRYIEQRLKESIKPADVRAEELTLKLLGLVPPDFDLRQNTIDLLTEQAAAFYDYNKKKLFILEKTPDEKGASSQGVGPDDELALVHELAHALADQHFPLAKFISEGLKSDDAATARQAVMEGQASWLMTAYLSKKAGGPAEVSDNVLDLMTHSLENSPGDYPVLSRAPPYIRDTLVFPYSDGMLFQNEVFHKLGQASFAEIFEHPPVSTQQILHPDRYLSHLSPHIPDAPQIPSAREFRKLTDGTLGELDFRILLSQYVGKQDGEQLAAHLVGSSYELLEHKHDRFPVLAVAATWDTPESAAKFFDEYRKVLQGKWKTLDIQSQTSSRLEGHGDSGYFTVWVDGATVQDLEGWKTPLH